MKICTRCSKELDKSMFNKDKSLKCGLTAQCKECRKKMKNYWIAKNKNKVQAYSKQYKTENAEKISKENKEYCKNYYCKNKERLLKEQAEYNKKNADKINARNSLRRATKKQRTPEWVLCNPDELWLISQFYIRAKELSELTGVKHHVDHIYPLHGKTVSGFHCWQNLQVIPWYENLEKGNKMPELI